MTAGRLMLVRRWTITWTTAPPIAVLVLAGSLALLWLDTRPLAVNDAFGYDGLQYARLALRLRSGTPVEIDAPYVYRLATPALVAASGLELRVGFFVLSVASALGAGLLLLALLRRYGADPSTAVLAVSWWGLLPYTLREALHTPVLIDELAFLILVALLLAGTTKRYLAFSVLLVIGALTRESLLLLAPFLWLRALPLGWQTVARAVAATAPALIVFALIHLAPPIPPSSRGLETTSLIGLHAYLIATNTAGHAVRALLGPLFGLGGLLGLAVGRLDALRRFLSAEPGWLFLVVATTVGATLGGLEHDRYLLALAPFLLVVGFARTSFWAAPIIAATLTFLHVIATRALVALPADETAHLDHALSTMPEGQLLGASLVPAIAALGIAVIVWRRERGTVPPYSRR
jgi:hypothetical protein